jgi:hypothetical protein
MGKDGQMKGTSAIKAAAREARAKAGAYARRLIDLRIEKQTGLRPIEQTDPRDVFICGYPKSGNTWFQHLATALVFGVDVELAPDALLNDLCPDVHFEAYYRRYNNPTFFKSHHLPRQPYRRIVYLIRDGRDAMVSYYHHLQATMPGVDFAEMVETGKGLSYGKWHEHVDAYLANPFGAEMMVIRYEDLKRDAATELRRFCTFSGLDRDDAIIRWAVDRASFDSMRRKEQQRGWETPGWPKDKPFVRRGRVGSFRDEMPAAVLDTFMRDSGRTLIAQGYAITA